MEDTTEITVASHDVPAPITSQMARAVSIRAQMEAEKEIRQVVREYVNEAMVEGTDYGKIPGTDKPTLLKPGSEKLIDLFRCSPDYEVARRIEDWDSGLFHYEIKCILRDQDGVVRAVGMGSANSREGRYRWRNGERTCPECGSTAIIKGKAEYGGGFVCFAKKGGCGAKFKDDDTRITEQQLGKVENDDIYTLVNTILKMAKKRSGVDASLALARCSDMFTQDVEDIYESHEPSGGQRSTRKKQPEKKGTESLKQKLRGVEQHVIDKLVSEYEACADPDELELLEKQRAELWGKATTEQKAALKGSSDAAKECIAAEQAQAMEAGEAQAEVTHG